LWRTPAAECWAGNWNNWRELWPCDNRLLLRQSVRCDWGPGWRGNPRWRDKHAAPAFIACLYALNRLSLILFVRIVWTRWCVMSVVWPWHCECIFIETRERDKAQLKHVIQPAALIFTHI
jgi:hypothetical protein